MFRWLAILQLLARLAVGRSVRLVDEGRSLRYESQIRGLYGVTLLAEVRLQEVG